MASELCGQITPTIELNDDEIRSRSLCIPNSIQMFLLLLLSFVALIAAGPPRPRPNSTGFYDSTCQKLRGTRAEMTAVNQAKMLGLGDHSCVSTYIKFFPNGTQNVAASLSFPSRVNSYYDAGTGSLHSDYYVNGVISVVIDEYIDGKGGVCIEIKGASNSGFYTESLDQNKNGLGSVWRAIGYYTPDEFKAIKGVQWFIPTVFGDSGLGGDVLSLTFLDENNRLDYINMQTCTRT